MHLVMAAVDFVYCLSWKELETWHYKLAEKLYFCCTDSHTLRRNKISCFAVFLSCFCQIHYFIAGVRVLLIVYTTVVS